MGTPSSASPPTFDITPSTLLQRADIAVNRLRRGVAHLVESVSPQQATFENAIRPLAEIDNEVKSSVQYIALFQAVSPSPELRKASSAATSIVDKAYLALFQHEGLFALVGAVHGNCSRSRDDLIDEEDRRLLDRFHRMFVDNGIELAGSARERYIWILRRLVDLRVAFMENLSNEPGYVWKAEHELEGVLLNTLELDKNYPSAVFRISLAKPSVNSILVNCHNADTRAEIFLKSQTLYQQTNVPIFREIINLRDEAARLLGFPSFAAQKLRQQLVKSPDRVCSLLDQLDLSLQPMAQQELQVLQKALVKPPRLSDFDFQHNQILKEKYHVDQELVAEYFPAQVTVRRMLNIFETLFALAIIELDNLTETCKWHPDVTAYEVWEADKSAFVGYLYIDIYPRPGKYNHAANFNIYPSYVGRDGKRTSVASALVCNVSRNSDDQPPLLRHREVITIFHELGHGIHDLLGKSKYAMFHGHRTVSDFSEAPSQLLEYWCWVPECLKRLSCHYSYLSPKYLQHWKTAKASKDALQPPMEIPDEIVHNLVAAKQLNQGILTLRQVAFSKFDMKIHNPASHDEIEAVDFSKLYNSLLQDMTGLQGPQDGLNWGSGHATSSHYIWGQEANYYSYLYTRILAADMWYTHFQSAPLNQDAGLKYRKMILNYGGSQDEWKLLTSFLGRDPNIQAYFKDIGATTPENKGEENTFDKFGNHVP